MSSCTPDSVIVKAKKEAGHKCIACGASKRLHVHHIIPGDDRTIVVLCAICHSKEHPDVPRELFTSNRGVGSYWDNSSAATIAKALGVHPRTIRRAVKKLQIPTGAKLTAKSAEAIMQLIEFQSPHHTSIGPLPAEWYKKVPRPRPIGSYHYGMPCPKCRAARVTLQGWRVKPGGNREHRAQCQECGSHITIYADQDTTKSETQRNIPTN